MLLYYALFPFLYQDTFMENLNSLPCLGEMGADTMLMFL